MREATIRGYFGLADLHGKKNKPRYRLDDYKASFFRKLSWCVEYANECDLRLIIAGDLFESVREGMEILNTTMKILREARWKPLVVYGQHDLLNHTKDLIDTPICNLIFSDTVILLDTVHEEGKYRVFGCGFEEEAPQINPSNTTDILVIHKSITPDEPPFFLPDAISAEEANTTFKNYRHVVAGDYHEAFLKLNTHGPNIINCGPMMRNSKTLMNHKPCGWEIINNSVTKVEIPIDPPEQVFDLEAIEFDETHGMTIDLSRMKELMGTATETIEFNAIVWTGYEEARQDKNCVIRKESVTKALRGEKIWNY